MKTFQTYLEGIRKNPTIGWRSAYLDILGVRLSDAESFLKGVDAFGEDLMFEALVVTSLKKLNSPDPLNYVLAVAQQKWKEALQQDVAEQRTSLQVERSIRKVREDNERLAEKIKEARRKVDANNSV